MGDLPTLPFPTRRAELSGCHVIALGSTVVVRADGDRGPRVLVLPVESYPPRDEPCGRCEHRARPECATIKGCPTAEGWEAARHAYAEEVPRA